MEPEDAAKEISGKTTQPLLKRIYLLTTALSAAYEKAQTIGPLKADIEQLVPAVLARAGFEKRQIEAGKGGMFNSLSGPAAHNR